MATNDEIRRYLHYLQKPLDIANPKYYKAEEVEVLKIYQEKAMSLFSDLKADNCIRFEDFFPESKADLNKVIEEDARVVKFTKLTINLAEKLKGEALDAEEQWFILLSLYVWGCEQIKRLFSGIIHGINITLGTNQLKLGKSVTLGPFLNVMSFYKKGKYKDLFSEIDVDLRNAFVHSSFDFPDDTISYDEKSISTLEFLRKYKKVVALFAILFSGRAKNFAKEFKELAERNGIVV